MIQNFSLSEFFTHCNDSEVYDVLSSQSKSRSLVNLAVIATKLRELAGCAITITSGYRGEEHNVRSGGSPTSQHMRMEAMDIRSSSRLLSPAKLVEVVRAYDELSRVSDYLPRVGQVIQYSSFVHVALACDKHKEFELSYA